SGSVFENAGTLELWTDAGVGGAGEFLNTGTLVKRGGATNPDLFYGSLFEVGHTVNMGTIRVEVGTLALAGTPATPVDNQGRIIARAEPGQPKTTLWLLSGLDSTGSIGDLCFRFHTAGPVVFSIAGSFAADRTQLYD